MAKKKEFGLKQLVKNLKKIKARDIMTKNVITTTENTSLADVAQIMISSRISGIPVVDKQGKVQGVITDIDLFMVMDMIESGEFFSNNASKPVSSVTVKLAMSTEVATITKETTLDEIISIMKYKNVLTLPVVEKKKMVGVIGRRDVFKNFYTILKVSMGGK